MAEQGSSPFSRLPPAILASIGFAAALGIYTLYTAVNYQGEPTLRRSNAVHRPRRDRPHVAQGSVPANEFGISNQSASGEEVMEAAETERLESTEAAGDREPNQSLRGLLYYIAEEASKRRAYEHHGISCEECGEYPIRGVRWHCLNCPDFDLCSTCEASSVHTQTHVFAKIKIPIPFLSQPTKEYNLWYPGDPRKIHPPLDAKLRKRLSDFYGFEEPRIDALYDQFTCIANVPWPSDQSAVCAAIDRRAFDKALKSERWPDRLSPNAVFDRMFAFYDTNQDGLIGFDELINGMAYLTGPNRFSSLHRAVRGYDIDGNGFVDRKDFLRLLRAKFTVQKQLVRDMIDNHEREQTQAAMEVLRSSQPISSVFSEEEIPLGVIRRPRGKQINAHGDFLPEAGTKTILDDDDPWQENDHPTTESHSNHAVAQPRSDRPISPISRFEELLFDSSGRTMSSSAELTDRSATSPAVPEVSSNGSTSLGSTQRDMDGGFRLQQLENLASHESLTQDMLWEITETGLNERLDPLFKAKELNDTRVMNTASERAHWRHEIDAFVRSKKSLMDSLAEGMHDPLMATAKQSLENSSVSLENVMDTQQDSVDDLDMQPTDSESLARREAEIAKTPLDELLSSAGYGLREGTSQETTSRQPQAAHIGASSIWNGVQSSTATSPLARVMSDNIVSDPTLPQNRPDQAQVARCDKNNMSEDSKTRPAGKVKIPIQKPPSRRILEEYATLDDQEREITERGGPGKLTYTEIEALALADPTKELRGLIRSWLEWAVF